MVGTIEDSAQLAALTLLGTTTPLKSHDTTFVFIYPAIKWVKGAAQFEDTAEIDSDCTSHVHCTTEMNGATATIHDLFDPNGLAETCSSDDETNVPSVTTDQDGAANIINLGNDIVAPQTEDENYALRGPPLADMNPVEYVCLIRVKKYTTGNFGLGRASYTTFAFDLTHPCYGTHVQVLQSKMFVPLLYPNGGGGRMHGEPKPIVLPRIG